MYGVVGWVKRNTPVGRGSQGQLLIEVLIALALIGLIATVFIGAMYTSLQAARVTDERSTALTLAKSQIEFVKARPYSDNDWEYQVDADQSNPVTAPSWWSDSPAPRLDDEYAGYRVAVKGASDHDNLIWVTELEELEGEGIRVITGTVFHGDKKVLELENYEVDR